MIKQASKQLRWALFLKLVLGYRRSDPGKSWRDTALKGVEKSGDFSALLHRTVSGGWVWTWLLRGALQGHGGCNDKMSLLVSLIHAPEQICGRIAQGKDSVNSSRLEEKTWPLLDILNVLNITIFSTRPGYTEPHLSSPRSANAEVPHILEIPRPAMALSIWQIKHHRNAQKVFER